MLKYFETNDWVAKPNQKRSVKITATNPTNDPK